MTRRVAWTATVLVAVFLLLPIFVVVPVAFNSSAYIEFPPSGFSLRWFEAFFSSPSWLDAAGTSLRIAAATTAIATVVGTLTAVGLMRVRGPAQSVVNAIVALPLVVPLVAYALGLYAVYAKVGLVGSTAGLILAHSALALPYVVLNVAAPLRTIDPNGARAAQSLGASPARAFITVVLPQIGPGVFAGALFAFLTSFDEVIVAIFVSGRGSTTLPVKMWESVETDLDPTIAAVATMLIATTIVLLAATAALTRTRRTEVSRVDSDA
jgi:putative spermidine/putrescine transport system permease protein